MDEKTTGNRPMAKSLHSPDLQEATSEPSFKMTPSKQELPASSDLSTNAEN